MIAEESSEILLKQIISTKIYIPFCSVFNALSNDTLTIRKFKKKSLYLLINII